MQGATRAQAKLGQAFDWLVNAMALIAGLLLIVVMLATVIKVGFRSMGDRGIIGIDQLSGTALVYMTFLGAAWVLRGNGHVTLDLLLASAGAEVKRWLLVVNSLTGAAVCLALSYFGFVAVEVSIARGVLVATEIEIPRAIGLIPIPVGALILGIEFLRRAGRAYRAKFEPAEQLRVKA